MAFTAEQLAQLEKAAASGQLRVQLGDKVIQYQNLPDLLKAIQVARNDLAAASAATSASLSPFRAVVATFHD
ncbi:MAG: hypothetical protein H6974_12270 [Gammaproteobacteria bacterium]|nr:hypothetical protein [Gammaproteobacteria bacterium]MCP5197537.1 hypothetical protein [Gammaproteobacteria bacterium]